MTRPGHVAIARLSNATVHEPLKQVPVTTSGVRAEIEAAFKVFRRKARSAVLSATSTPRSWGFTR
jgi:hypothetical protein